MKYLLILFVLLVSMGVKAQEKEAKYWTAKYSEMVDKQDSFYKNDQLESFIHNMGSVRACKDSMIKYQSIWKEQLDSTMKDIKSLIQLKMDMEVLSFKPVDSTLWKQLQSDSIPIKDAIIYPETSKRLNISCYHLKRRKKLLCHYN